MDWLCRLLLSCWWILGLSIVVLYLLFKVIQIIIFLKDWKAWVLKKFELCNCDQNPDKPPPEEPGLP